MPEIPREDDVQSPERPRGFVGPELAQAMRADEFAEAKIDLTREMESLAALNYEHETLAAMYPDEREMTGS